MEAKFRLIRSEKNQECVVIDGNQKVVERLPFDGRKKMVAVVCKLQYYGLIFDDAKDYETIEEFFYELHMEKRHYAYSNDNPEPEITGMSLALFNEINRAFAERIIKNLHKE